ncbi:F-box only protein 30-like [Antedon mediterranea]|uniref:F-box only protein 30-like n=1 Tax=Antedon mediterranea TaxID=105859 RepID=UPI003AF89FFD
MENSSTQLHSHCDSCFQMFCNEKVPGCEMKWCELNCGACFHACKKEDHGNVCINKWIDCVNSGYGCPLTMPRWQMMKHIKRCPASVVHCTMEWNRRITTSNSKLQLPEYSAKKVHTSQLDLALAVRDQQVLLKSKKDEDLNASTVSPTSSFEVSSLAKRLTNCFYNVKCSHCQGRQKRFETRYGHQHVHHQNETTDNGGFIACTKRISNEEHIENIPTENDETPDSSKGKNGIVNTNTSSTGTSKANKTLEQFSNGSKANKTQQEPCIDITLESMPRYQRKPSSMHTFLCQKNFRRDEINNHIQNVHSEIHAGLNGWLEPRCPLAQYGCTFSQHRFHPEKKGAKVIYSQALESFGLKPKPLGRHRSFMSDNSEDEELETTNNLRSKDRRENVAIDLEKARYNLNGTDYISHLPLELLRHIVRMLDSFSISSLSLTSQVFRQVCCSLLEERGMVVPRWVKLNKSWEMKSMVWQFSTSFTGISFWKFEESHLISEHLKSCEYNNRLLIKKPVQVIITNSIPSTQLRHLDKDAEGPKWMPP